MIKKLFSVLVILLITVMSSCAQANNEGTVNSGDRIGNFLITTGVNDEVVYAWDREQYFVKQGDQEIYFLELPIGTKMNVSAGVYRFQSCEPGDRDPDLVPCQSAGECNAHHL